VVGRASYRRKYTRPNYVHGRSNLLTPSTSSASCPTNRARFRANYLTISRSWQSNNNLTWLSFLARNRNLQSICICSNKHTSILPLSSTSGNAVSRKMTLRLGLERPPPPLPQPKRRLPLWIYGRIFLESDLAFHLRLLQHPQTAVIAGIPSSINLLHRSKDLPILLRPIDLVPIH